jgi:malonate-semialdehyde dehydrogenase (acetylating)/methylmalonate-semialdehyde dehydrogenase
VSTSAQLATPAVRAIGHFIDGRERAGSSGRSGAVFDPALGEVRSQCAFANTAETRDAILAAKAALPAWAATPPLQRARVLFRFKELLDRHADELASLITREHGKVQGDARGEVGRGIEVVEFACGIPHLLKGEFSDSVGRRRQLVIVAAGGVCRHHAAHLLAMVPL